MNLYYILLETRTNIYSAEVGAEYTDDAIELFYIWLTENGVEDIDIINEVAHYNGDCIGTHPREEVLEDTVKVTTPYERRLNFDIWKLMDKREIEKICMCDCHRVGLAGFYHCLGLVCCNYENSQYLVTPTKPVDLESGRIALNEKGVFDKELYKQFLLNDNNFPKQKKRKACSRG
jgi:hypothetical protein